MAHNRDYVQIAVDYAKDAIKQKRRKKNRTQGKYLILAAERFLKDLERAKKTDCPFLFDVRYAADPCDFIEKLPHVQGVWDTPTITLHPSQIFFIVQLFGFRDRQSGLRRYTSALLLIGRKNAKSTLAAAIMLYCLCFENEPGAQIKTAATTFPQATIIFDIAKQMVEREVELRQQIGLETFAKSIARASIGGRMEPIHAKASTQDGLNPSHCTLDEIHAHKSADLLNVLQSAAGARACPLFLFTTTEGYVNAGPWADLRLFAKKLLEGVFKETADHFLAVIYMVDPGDADYDETAWRKANPLMDANPYLLPTIRKEWIEAKEMPSKKSEFKIKRLNRPAAVAEGWVDLEKFNRCDGEVDLDWLEQYPCWGGLDLASTKDLTAFYLIWIVGEVIYTKGWIWVPSAAVAFRTERGTVPYAGWVEAGLMKQTEGETTDYNVMAADIIALSQRFAIQKVAYDRWNASAVAAELTEAGVECVEFIQGTKSYHPAMQRFEIAYISGKLAHNGDPVLTWCASNFVRRVDAGLRGAPDRRKAADKIDAMAALLMAIGVSEGDEPADLSFLNDPIIAGRR